MNIIYITLQRIIMGVCFTLMMILNYNTAYALTANNHVDIGSSKELAYDYVARYTDADVDPHYVVDRIWEEADKYGIYDKTALLALFETESSWKMQIAADEIGFGLGQLSFEYWSGYDLNSQDDIYDLTQNIHGSVYYYAKMLQAANGDPAIAYTGYNGGAGNMGNLSIPAIVEHMNNFIANYNRLKTGDPGVGYQAGVSSIINYFSMNSVLNRPLGLDFSYIYKMGSSIRTIVDSIVDGCVIAIKSLIQISLPLLAVLAIIDFSMFAWRGPTITGQLDSAFWTGAAQRIVKYGFLTILIESWQFIVNKVFIGTAKWSYATFSPDTANAIGDITAPDQQLQHFISFLNPSMTWLGKVTALDMINHMGLFLLNMFATYMGLILIIILIFSILVVYLEFYMSAVFTVFSISFAGLKPTSFIPEGMMSHLITGTIRLMCIGLIFSIMKKAMEVYTYDPTDIFGILGALLFVVVVVVVGVLLPNRIADGLQVSAKL